MGVYIVIYILYVGLQFRVFFFVTHGKYYKTYVIIRYTHLIYTYIRIYLHILSHWNGFRHNLITIYEWINGFILPGE